MFLLLNKLSLLYFNDFKLLLSSFSDKLLVVDSSLYLFKSLESILSLELLAVIPDLYFDKII